MNSPERGPPEANFSLELELLTIGLKLALCCLLTDLMLVALTADRPKLTLFKLY
jgi:hypothetical protein